MFFKKGFFAIILGIVQGRFFSPLFSRLSVLCQEGGFFCHLTLGSWQKGISADPLPLLITPPWPAHPETGQEGEKGKTTPIGEKEVILATYHMSFLTPNL